MLVSLFSGITGLQAHQERLNVISNNIANVNTHGYKRSSLSFQDIYYQTASAGSAGTAGTVGGTNPRQVGYGTRVGGITKDMGRTGFEATNSGLDMAIDGDGFFVVKDGSGGTYYTRMGRFHFDDKGQLVDLNGSLVLDTTGTAITVANAATAQSITFQKDGSIKVVDKDGKEQAQTQTIAVAAFPNPEGLLQAGSSYFSVSAASGAPTPATGGKPGENGTGFISTGYLEMSNVDLSREFTDMITTQRGFQANSRIITTSDTILEELVNLKR